MMAVTACTCVTDGDAEKQEISSSVGVLIGFDLLAGLLGRGDYL